MGHTPQQRDDHPLCGARKKNGQTCRAFAGQGTPHTGIGRCKHHGGNSPNGKKYAAALEVKAQMVKFGLPIDGISPQAALLRLVSITAGHCAWLYEQVAATDNLADPETQVIVEQYGVERDRLARVSEAAAKAGATQSQIVAAERTAATLTTLLREVMDELEFTPAQRDAIGPAVRRAIERSFTEADDDPESAVQTAWAA